MHWTPLPTHTYVLGSLFYIVLNMTCILNLYQIFWNSITEKLFLGIIFFNVELKVLKYKAVLKSKRFIKLALEFSCFFTTMTFTDCFRCTRATRDPSARSAPSWSFYWTFYCTTSTSLTSSGCLLRVSGTNAMAPRTKQDKKWLTLRRPPVGTWLVASPGYRGYGKYLLQ